jgi:aryl-alcohol dehydrogenase-like predicted oxidoreductase
MGVITYSPLQQGVLTDVMQKIVADMAPFDFRRNNPHFKEPEISANLKMNEELAVIARKYGRSLAQLAIAWVLREDGVTSALNGARNRIEIEDSVKAADLKISSADLIAIETILEERLKKVPLSAQVMPPGAGGPPASPPPPSPR